MSPLPTAWTAALARRAGAPERDAACLRLLHGEDADVRCDRYGDVCWFYRYADGEPDADEQAAYTELTRGAGSSHWHAHGMHDRGRDPSARRHWSSPEAPQTWTATEEDLTYRLRADRGQSPGLFLDQRRNRAWVRDHAGGARVANLFAYTGGFGLAARAGGAAQVAQVDVSRPYLDWAADNARLNGFDPEAIEHAAVDARLFLQGCARRGRRFDGIVCDPPSFGRAGGRGARRRGSGGKGGVFRVRDELPGLVAAGVDVVDPGGWVLVCCNYEGWTPARFQEIVAAAAPSGRVEAAPGPGPDFTEGHGAPRLLSCLLRVD